MTRSKIQDCRVFFGGVLFFSTLAVSYPAFSQIKPVDARIDSVLAMMTLEEKVGQMNQYNGFWDATGPQPTATDAAAKPVSKPVAKDAAKAALPPPPPSDMSTDGALIDLTDTQRPLA